MISDDVQCPAFDNGNIDINLCLNDAILHEKLPSIVQDLNVNPLVTLKLFSAAFFEVTRIGRFIASSFLFAMIEYPGILIK